MKSRGLEALERIGKCYVKSESKDLMFTDDYGDDYDIIERELKALEILKKYLYYDNKNHAIKMKEVRKSIYNFDLLKKVLEEL